MRRLVWRGFLIAVLISVVWFILVPQFRDASVAWNSLGLASIPLALLGLVLELASLISYSGLTRISLNRLQRPSFFTLARIDLACLGVNNVVPGGGATATAAKFRMLTLAKTRPSDAVAGTMVEVSVSVLALGGIFGLGIVLSLSSIRQNPGYVVASGVILAVAVIAAVGAALLGYYRDNTIRVVGAAVRRIPFLSEDAAMALVGMIADELQEFRADRKRILVTSFWATTNWMLDATALWVILLAFGYRDNFAHLLVVYGLASILGMLPITPGGLGIVEGVLVPALVGFGSPQGIALLAVISWRLVQFWLPIPLAGAAYLSLRVGVLRRVPPGNTPALDPLNVA